MKSLFSTDTKNIIRDRYQDNPVYLLIRPTAQTYQQKLDKVKLAPQEIFAECFSILDRIKIQKDQSYCAQVFDDSYSDILNLFPDSRENEIRTAASLITLSVAFCLNAIPWNEQAIPLLESVMSKDTEWDEISRSYATQIPTHAQPLQSFLTDYISSDRKISQEISSIPGSRQIDTEQLKTYFTPAFRGIGRGALIDQYSKLEERLKAERNAKDFALIAKMIYDSPHHINKQNTFKKWHQTFCAIIGCKYVEYRPNQLTPSEAIKQEFLMLQ